MRILLLEAPNITNIKVDPADISAWQTADDRKRSAIITKIIKNAGYKGNDFKYRNALSKSAFNFGIDPKTNPFIGFLLTWENQSNGPKDEYLSKLVDIYGKKRIDLSDDFYWDVNTGLYDRTLPEFEYTVNIYHTVTHPELLSRYYKDISKISDADLFDESGKLKPAGSKSTADDLNTIFGTVESWSGTDFENELTTKPASNPSKTKVDPKVLAAAKKSPYDNLSQVPNDRKVDGAIVYLNTPAEGNTPPDEYINNWDPGYFIYSADDKKWTRLVNYN